MKSLLRSLFVSDRTDDEKQLLLNYRDFVDAGLGFDVPEYNAVWTYIQSFVQQHNHVPNVATLRAHFQHTGEDTVTDQLEVLIALSVRDRGDFQRYLEIKVEDHRTRRWSEIMKEAAVITKTGLEVKTGKEKRILKGPVAAVRHIMDHSAEIVAPVLSMRLSGEVRKDSEDFTAEYDRVESDPQAGIGQFSFIQQMDVALAGAKRNELWLHAAFTGGLKSTFSLNWAYNQAVFYGHSSLFFSLEMPYQQVRRILYAMHSHHPKFRTIRYQLGLQRGPHDDIGLPYQDIRDGQLNQYHVNAKKFLFEYVVPDFKDPSKSKFPDDSGHTWPTFYGGIHIEVADPNKDDFTVGDIRNTAEVLHSETPISMIFVDHAGLVSPRSKHASTTENLNEVLRDLKRLAMSFRRGAGIAVVALFQISREGYKAALKAKESGGKPGYNLTHLSYANEAERSSDIVTASWVDDEYRDQNRVLFQCLKSRDQKPFDSFTARVEWPCRRILTCFDIPQSADEMAKRGAEIDSAVQALEEG